MAIQSICVCGAGTMGSGIAQLCAQHGFSTLLFDLNAGILDKARQQIESQLASLVTKNKISAADREGTLSRLQFTTDLQSCLADVFIEAIIEKVEAKIALFNQLAELNHSDCVFATNTSSLPVEQIAKGVMHPGRVIGLHFFNPAPVMKLVEIVTTSLTTPEVLNTVTGLAASLHKTAVVCKDSPGFIVNRVARPYYIESLRMAEAGRLPMDGIDDLLEATGFRMGPFRLMDLIGNDINYAVSVSVYEQMGKPDRLKPSVIQEQLVSTGRFGKKSGEGYYHYSKG